MRSLALVLTLGVAACSAPDPVPPRDAAPAAPEPAEEPAPIDEAELLVAAAVRADAVSRIEYQHRLIALRPPPIETLAREASDPRGDSLERQIAAWALGELDDAEACHVLAVLWLQSDEAAGDTRMAVAIGMARCGTLGPLRSMMNSGSLVPRLKAMVTLALLEDHESRLAVEVLSTDPLAGGYEPFFDLAKALLGDAGAGERSRPLAQDPVFGDYVILALARSGIELQATELERIAAEHPEPVLREMALQARALQVDDALDALTLHLLDDPAPRVRGLADLLRSLPGELQLEAGPAE